MNQDLRHGLRMMLRSPGFTAVAVLSLAVGIGANIAIFSLVNALLLRPLPVPQPDRIVSVYTSDFSGPPHGSSSYPDYVDFAAGSRDVFTGLAAFTQFPVSYRAGDRNEIIWGEMVSANYFDVLGTTSQIGRSFRPEEERAPVVVLSDVFWRRRFAADSNIIGRPIVLGGHPYTVIGVAPAKFTGALRFFDVSFWASMGMESQLTPGNNRVQGRGSRGLIILGRLQPNASLEQTQARMGVLAGQLHQTYPQSWTDRFGKSRRITVVRESESRVPPSARLPVIGFMGLLFVVVGLVLMVACANLANLLLARATVRRREIAVRLALGAGRLRVIRQLLTENILLAALGGGAGILVSIWAAGLLELFKPPIPVPVILDLGADYRVIVFAFLLSLLTGVAMGLLPAVSVTRGELAPGLYASGVISGTGVRRFSVRNLLVVAQIAASLVLLIGAGLFVRSLRSAYSVDLGFDPDRMAVVAFNLRLQGYDEPRGRLLMDAMLDKARSIPGVQSAVFAQVPLLGMEARQRRGFRIEGYTPRPGEDMEYHFNHVGPGYFRTLGAKLLEGREFTSDDRTGAQGAVVVTEAFAKRFWPGQNAIGKRLLSGRQTSYQVVGVVANARYVFLNEPALPMVFLAAAQNYSSGMTLHVRTSGDPAAIVPVLRKELLDLNKDLPIVKAATLFEHMGTALLPARMAGFLFSVFGLIALALATLGTYGVVAYAVTQRTREIGVRIALGARHGEILGFILRGGAGLAVTGVAIGLAVSLVVTRFLSTFLYGISPTDPVTFAGISILLMLIALAACYIPARRAGGIDPMVALRHD